MPRVGKVEWVSRKDGRIEVRYKRIMQTLMTGRRRMHLIGHQGRIWNWFQSIRESVRTLRHSMKSWAMSLFMAVSCFKAKRSLRELTCYVVMSETSHRIKQCHSRGRHIMIKISWGLWSHTDYLRMPYRSQIITKSPCNSRVKKSQTSLKWNPRSISIKTKGKANCVTTVSITMTFTKRSIQSKSYQGINPLTHPQADANVKIRSISSTCRREAVLYSNHIYSQSLYQTNPSTLNKPSKPWARSLWQNQLWPRTHKAQVQCSNLPASTT